MLPRQLIRQTHQLSVNHSAGLAIVTDFDDLTQLRGRSFCERRDDEVLGWVRHAFLAAPLLAQEL